MSTLTVRTLVLLGLLALAPAPRALPIVSIDTDLLTAGVQSTASVASGQSITVGVVATGVDPPGINGYDLALAFDATAVAGSGSTDGGFLLAPALAVLDLVLPGSVRRSAISLVPVVGATGDGLLATFSLSTLAAGDVALALSLVQLSGVGSTQALGLDDVRGATLRIAAPVSAPGTAVLVGAALLGLATARRRVRG